MAIEASGVEVGVAVVSIIPSAAGFGKKLKAEVTKEFATADLDKMVTAAFGRHPLRIPVQPVIDPSARTQRIDVPVGVDATGVGAQVRAVVNDIERRTTATIRLEVDKRGPGDIIPSGLLSRLNGIGAAAGDVAGQAGRMGASLAGAAATAAGPLAAAAGVVGLLAAGIGGAAAAAIAAIPAMSALAGAAAAIPTGITGLGAAVATLGLGFQGIREAFQPRAGGGGSSGGGGGASKAAVDLASQARQVAQATRSVEAAQRSLVRAQRDVVGAQKAVNDAIAGEVERRQDLSRELRSARLDQRDAALGVDESLRALNFAKEAGDIPAIRRAQLDLDQARARVADTADAADDLQKEQSKAARTSVRDSDAVREALDRRQAAIEGVRSATDQLRTAQENLVAAKNPFSAPSSAVGGGGASGGGGYGGVVKLAPSAQRFVDAIKALKPAFEALRLDVQERLFKGLDKTVTRLGEAWIPQLRITLGNYADTFNRFFRDLGAGLSQPKFISDLAAGAEGFRQGLEAIGTSITQGLTPAFGALSRAGAPFMKALGEQIAGIVDRFSEWVLAGERSGALQKFFTNATQAMRDIFSVGGQVARIIGNIIEIIVGQPIGSTTKTPLQQFRDGLKSVADFLDNPSNQQRIRDFIASIQNGFVTVGRVVKDIDGAVAKAQGWYDEFDRLARQVSNIFGGYTSDGTRTLGSALWQGLVDGLKSAASRTAETISGLFWRGPNSLIGRLKRGLGIASPSRVTTVIGQQVMDGLIRGIGDRFGALADRVRGLPNRIRVAFGTAAQILLGRGRDVINGLNNGITERLGYLRDRVGSLRDRIRNALGDTGGLLYNTGKNIIYGLWNGIASLGNWLAGRVRDFVNAYVPGPIQRALEMNSPSKVAMKIGRGVPEGLALGIESGNRLVESAAAGMATAALPAIGPVPVGNPTRGVNAAATGGRPVLGWARDARGDRLLDALRELIEVRYNGDVDAALAGR